MMNKAALEPSISFEYATRSVWDALVIGAGPAGAFAAYKIAKCGMSVLLVDRSPFPRYKVCGCCLNAAALKMLAGEGLFAMPELAEAVPLTEYCLSVQGSVLRIRLPAGAALSREQFDTAVLRAAMGAGAHFMPSTAAAVGEAEDQYRLVHIASNGARGTLRARVVIVADGIGGRALASVPGFQPSVSPLSRIGAGTMTWSDQEHYRAGTIYMACTDGNYVGVVRLPDGRLDLAAAFEPRFLKQSGSPGAAAERTLQAAGLAPISGIRDLHWQGTVPLNRSRRRIAAYRLFVIGDAALYVEPFTGEGIAWALWSADTVTPLVAEAIKDWRVDLPERWQSIHHRNIGRHSRVARIVGSVLRQNTVTAGLCKVFGMVPGLAEPLVKYINEL
ncbi:MAG TPA: lycopene cyclase family protein [Candidatus Obscuribacterales bacterium]